MILKCLYNKYSQAKLSKNLEEFLDSLGQSILSDKLTLSVGEYYTCYAVVFGLSSETWYFIMDESGVVYPKMYPAHIFSCENTMLSRYWQIGQFTDNLGSTYPMLAFLEWATNDLFHGELLEGNEFCLSIFEKYKEKMDEEFLTPSVSEYAKKVGSGLWVTDNDYSDSWESNPLDALTRSPSKELLINPYYIK